MKVKIYTIRGDDHDAVCGTLELKDGKVVAAPHDLRMVDILESPVRERKTGRPLYSDRDPEAFLQNLQYQYRSAYLRAGAVEA